jgi:hypothetical protein
VELTHPACSVESVGGVEPSLLAGAAGWSGAEEAGPLLLSEAVALAADVEDVAVVEEPVEDGGGDDRVAEHLAPLGEALVGGQDHAAALVASRDQGEEGGGGRAVVGPDAELVDDQHLGGELDAQVAVEAVLGLGAAEVFHQVVGAGEVDAVAGLDRLEAERDGEMALDVVKRMPSSVGVHLGDVEEDGAIRASVQQVSEQDRLVAA